MPNQQGPLAAYDIPVYQADCLIANVLISTSGYTQLVACPSYASGANPTYRPVIYVQKVEFSDATASNFSFAGSDGTVLGGPYQNVATFQTQDNGSMNTNPCAAGSGFGVNFVTAPAAPFGIKILYWFA